MVNYSLHRLAGDLISSDPYTDGTLNQGCWNDDATPEFKEWIKELTNYDLDTDEGKKDYIVIVKQILLPILDAYPDIESLSAPKDWMNKTYKSSGVPSLTYQTITNDIDTLLRRIAKSPKLIKLIYDSNYVLKFKEETDKIRKLAIFLLILIDTSPIEVN